jgi:hypothetical protein
MAKRNCSLVASTPFHKPLVAAQERVCCAGVENASRGCGFGQGAVSFVAAGTTGRAKRSATATAPSGYMRGQLSFVRSLLVAVAPLDSMDRRRHGREADALARNRLLYDPGS